MVPAVLLRRDNLKLNVAIALRPTTTNVVTFQLLTAGAKRTANVLKQGQTTRNVRSETRSNHTKCSFQFHNAKQAQNFNEDTFLTQTVI